MPFADVNAISIDDELPEAMAAALSEKGIPTSRAALGLGWRRR
jgi:hypothetical protein